MHSLGGEKLEEKDSLEELALDGIMQLDGVFKKWQCLEWDRLTQNRKQSQAFLNSIINLRFTPNIKIFLNIFRRVVVRKLRNAIRSFV